MYDESANELCEASLKFIMRSGNKSNQQLLKLFATTSYRPYIKRSCVSQTNVTLRLMINTLTWQAIRKVLILLNIYKRSRDSTNTRGIWMDYAILSPALQMTHGQHYWREKFIPCASSQQKVAKMCPLGSACACLHVTTTAPPGGFS
jgi:hypothetical protein